jgi:hypothetical protein
MRKRINKPAAEVMWTHCMLHRESLARKQLCPELSEVMNTMIKTVNYLKTPPFCRITCMEMEVGTQYQALLCYCNSYWLSRGNFVACVYDLLGEVALFLEEENLVHA